MSDPSLPSAWVAENLTPRLCFPEAVLPAELPADHSHHASHQHDAFLLQQTDAMIKNSLFENLEGK